jgi:hypothetical protein
MIESGELLARSLSTDLDRRKTTFIVPISDGGVRSEDD